MIWKCSHNCNPFSALGVKENLSLSIKPLLLISVHLILNILNSKYLNRHPASNRYSGKLGAERVIKMSKIMCRVVAEPAIMLLNYKVIIFRPIKDTKQ